MSCAVLSAVVSLGWSRVGLDFCHSASWPTKHRDLDWNTSCSWARLVVQKEPIGRGSLQVSLGNITADTATNCGVTHIGSELPELQGVEKSNQQLKGVKPGVERTDV